MPYKDIEKRRSYDRFRWKRDHTKRSAANKAYQEKNKEKLLIKAKERRDRNKEAYNERSRVYAKGWRDNNKDKVSMIQRNYYNRHKERIKIIKRVDALNRYYKLRELLLFMYGGNPPHCACCGETIIKLLTIDHIKGGGSAEYRLLRSSGAYRKMLKERDFSKYRVLCFNCNCGRSANGGICPHEENAIKESVVVHIERSDE